MSKFWKLFLLLHLLSGNILLFAQNSQCIDFEQYIEPGTYGIATGYMPGDTLFTDENVSVQLQNFHYADSTTDFLNATISDDPIFNGDETELLHHQYIFPSNINLLFNFTRVRGRVQQVCLHFIDGGGVENLSVNGSPVRVLQNFVGLGGQEIAPGVTARVALSEHFDFPAGTLCFTGPIDSLLIGGQELVLDDVCFRAEENNSGDDTCHIANFRAEVLRCNPDGSFNLRLNFDHQRPSSDSFFVIFRGVTLGRFAVSQLPLTIESLHGANSAPVQGIQVCFPTVASQNECCVEATFRVPDCSNNNDSCALGAIRFSNLECIPDNRYRVTINFEHNRRDGRFVLQSSGGFRDTFNYSQLPLRLPITRANDSLDILYVCDLQSPNCCTRLVLELPCRENNDTCALGAIRFSNLECIPDNRYRVTINFEHNRRDGRFILQSFSGFRDTFNYSQLPLRLPITRANDSLDILYVCDLQSPNCCTRLVLELPCRENNDTCALGAIRFSNLECIPDNRYRVTINFEHNRREGRFILQSLSGFRDTFNYSQLPLRLPIPRANDSLDILYVCDLQSPNCCTRLVLELPCRDTSTNTCNIQNLTAQPTRCVDGKFMLQVSFRAQNTGALGYLVFVDGQIFGPFRYNQTSLQLGPFTADGLTIYDVLVLDVDDPTCYAYTEVRPVRCDDTPTCEITDLRVAPLPCDSTGTFGLILNFNHQRPAPDSFFVRYRGEDIGRFSVNQLPLTIRGLRGGEESHQESISVCFPINNAGSGRCCSEVRFMTPGCNTPNADTCRIYNVVARALPCDSIGRFYVKLHFESEHTSSGGFSVRGNGRVYGNFRYSQDSILIGPLPGNGTTRYEFVIQDNEKPECRNVINLGPIACEQPVWPGDANVNNRADHIDLLNIGLAYGAQGPARTAPTINWQEQRALSWSRTFADGTNYAQADCNGDGIVNSRDREAIARNYGLTHGATEPVTPLPGTDLDPPIFVDLPNAEGLPAGLAFTAPVILGTANNFVENIYGIAFSVAFNPRVIDPASIQVSYPKSWFGTENIDFISFHQIDTAAGLIHIAVTRIDQRNVSGFGAIALISGVIDDIAGIVGDSEVKVKGVRAIDLNQQLIPLSTPTQILKIAGKKPAISVGKLDLQRSLRLMPNPTNDWVQIFTKYQVPIKSIEIVDANGKTIRQPELNTDRISLSGLPQGIYILRIQIGEYLLNERIVKL